MILTQLHFLENDYGSNGSKKGEELRNFYESKQGNFLTITISK